ncbi:MAG: methyltransferase domain-containing protein [Candidatus Latescibacterota bacterium]
MPLESRFEERYKAGDAPWDLGTPDDNLIDVIGQQPIGPCRALDVGCGTGDNAIWLAQRRFVVTGCDLSPTAIRKAMEKAALAHITCSFLVADFLNTNIPGAPFGFVFDRGCLHTFDTEEERRQFAGNVASHLEQGGLWLTLAGNADGKAREMGPAAADSKRSHSCRGALFRDYFAGCRPFFLSRARSGRSLGLSDAKTTGHSLIFQGSPGWRSRRWLCPAMVLRLCCSEMTSITHGYMNPRRPHDERLQTRRTWECRTRGCRTPGRH